ncbi:CAP domain-containing protein [Microvirga calopogonii]|uniref:CAP domain-containing protein n=1 Tax=Microvirga calopogonii TaxID=2078013 RepID=UPI000E0D39DB|nr:CAP domain-containing protein [Microvirga calopogonii]
MSTPTNLETYFLQLVNETRAQAGVKALTFDGELLNSSDAHNAWMDQTNNFSHTGIDRSNAGDRMTAAGYGWEGWGENIGYRSGRLDEATVQKLHALLVNSPEHYANIVNGSFEEIGIGLKEADFNGKAVVLVTQNFGTPNAAERAEANDVGSATPTTSGPYPGAWGETIYGDSGGDTLYGTAGNDTIYGRSGYDTLDGMTGADAMYGGPGYDLYYVDNPGDKAYEDAGNGYDHVISTVSYSLYGQVIEKLSLRGTADIDGTGNSLNNWIDGNPGSNVLDGAAGDDILKGRGGDDILKGGSGKDAFVFDFADEARGDTIVDFEHGTDVIDLHFIDADTNVDGKQPFVFIGSERFNNVAGELHTYRPGDGNTYISADTNGDGRPEFSIKVLGRHTFGSADFVL